MCVNWFDLREEEEREIGYTMNMVHVYNTKLFGWILLVKRDNVWY